MLIIGNEKTATPNVVLNAWKQATTNTSPDSTREWDKHLVEVQDSAGFHWRHGIYFKRLGDGSVRVTNFIQYNGATYETFVIPADEWASIVCAVSAGGETPGKWDQVRRFHLGGAK